MVSHVEELEKGSLMRRKFVATVVAAARVAESPEGDMWIDVYGPLDSPDSVAVTTRTAGR
ncbi:hypothetical protein FG87_08235 [Nocardia vulneris]|uniref:Uncharacterized protein n=1 Tax=Nocardia vulneris TaxID=1141657 RepID=A0ABR4ZJJ5_9NOCA|nr:hypothetical protein FG87_08235 [Nocardia vulneris]